MNPYTLQKEYHRFLYLYWNQKNEILVNTKAIAARNF